MRKSVLAILTVLSLIFLSLNLTADRPVDDCHSGGQNDPNGGSKIPGCLTPDGTCCNH